VKTRSRQFIAVKTRSRQFIAVKNQFAAIYCRETGEFRRYYYLQNYVVDQVTTSKAQIARFL
jgi:hypothetical protein